jgi:hypothetical protein
LIWNSVTQTCICQSGFVLSENRCIRCRDIGNST